MNAAWRHEESEFSRAIEDWRALQLRVLMIESAKATKEAMRVKQMVDRIVTTPKAGCLRKGVAG